jgi:hypothetical protein
MSDVGASEQVALSRLLDDPDATVRYAAISSLGAMANPELRHLRAALKDPEEDIRVAALTAVGRLTSAEAEATLVGALRDSSADVREAAAAALVQRKTPAADRPRARRHALVRTWYDNPSLDGSSMIYDFRADGSGEVEDFAMGVSRERARFTYEIDGGQLAMRFSGRRRPIRVGFKISPDTYRDPIWGSLYALRLQFDHEPYFRQFRRAPRSYFNVRWPQHRGAST